MKSGLFHTFEEGRIYILYGSIMAYRQRLNKDERLETLQKLPQDITQSLSLDELANAGFYYAETSNDPGILRCAYCSAVVGNWTEADDPWEVHLACTNTPCPYVERLKGDDFVRSMLEKISLKEREEIDANPSAIETLCLPGISDPIIASEQNVCDARYKTAAVTYDSNYMATLHDRLKSYKGRDMYGKVNELAEDGFYFEGLGPERDSVRCFCCKNTMYNIKAEDDLITEHARLFNCDFIVKKKGLEFVIAARRTVGKRVQQNNCSEAAGEAVGEICAISTGKKVDFKRNKRRNVEDGQEKVVKRKCVGLVPENNAFTRNKRCGIYSKHTEDDKEVAAKRTCNRPIPVEEDLTRNKRRAEAAKEEASKRKCNRSFQEKGDLTLSDRLETSTEAVQRNYDAAYKEFGGVFDLSYNDAYQHTSNGGKNMISPDKHDSGFARGNNLGSACGFDIGLYNAACSNLIFVPKLSFANGTDISVHVIESNYAAETLKLENRSKSESTEAVSLMKDYRHRECRKQK